MKIISSDNAKTLVILVAAGAAAYVLYKLVSGAGSIKQAVTDTVDKIGDVARRTYHEANLAATRVGATARQAASPGVVLGTGPDQSAAETARLGRQDASVSVGLPAAPVPEASSSGDYRVTVPEEGVPPWVLGSQTSSYDEVPVMQNSPDAVGMSA